MKKLLSLLFAVLFLFCLTSCNREALTIEDHEWKMRTVMNNGTNVYQNNDNLVVAVGKADDIHPDANIVNLILVAKDGIITVKDLTNKKIYTGSYEVQNKTPKGTDYEIKIDGISGNATVGNTEYNDGSVEPTLPISIGDYTLYFIPV